MGTWNVRGLNGKEVELVDELRNSNICMMAITETKKKGRGETRLADGSLLIYSGVEEKTRARAGVACLVRDTYVHQIKGWKYISERIMVIIIQFDKKEQTTIIVCYGPDENDLITEKLNFWKDLQGTLDDAEGMVVITGDLNARVGNDTKKWGEVIGRHGEDRVNRNGKLMLEFCLDNHLIITNTIFEHKAIHKITRECKSKGEKSIIDYFITNRINRNKITDTRVKRGYEINSDHYLLQATIQMAHNNNNRHQQQCRNSPQKVIIKYHRLREEDVKGKYKNIIDAKIEHANQIDNNSDINTDWNIFKNIIVDAASESCGVVRYTNNSKRTAWWSREIKEVVGTKKKLSFS